MSKQAHLLTKQESREHELTTSVRERQLDERLSVVTFRPGESGIQERLTCQKERG
ncbi:MAG: hypothetical protein KZQ99_19005 [Candidatus Thiodiazotropha sp. (ex Dulcina madagascariensis)]|nr:hypothetical protein [Candidatus Thiodiazotropha sp. (ex Dulcina madagascariensis)]